MTDVRPWWEDAVVYQVYPRSFADSDGDGIGDLNGVRTKLSYLADLGVNAIWLTPFYPSPLADGGYDVSDYCNVDPLLGSLADFDALVKEAGTHGIRVIVDIVPNHCSIEHSLFQAALAAGPGSPERDRFIFRTGRARPSDQLGDRLGDRHSDQGDDQDDDQDGDELPPNNWLSVFGGPAWTRLPDGQWYLHLFDSSQPDFNWHHPDIPLFFADVIRFWMDRGAAGLRVDVANSLFKDLELPDIPETTGLHAPSAHHHRAELHELYPSWRAILDSYPADEFPGRRTAIGEVWYDVPETLAPYLKPGGLPQVFNFQLLQAPWDADGLRAAIEAATAMTGGSRAPWVLGNHDVPRPVTRFGGASAGRAAALLQLALPGSAYIYQGEELGLPEVTDLPDDARQDPTFFRTSGAIPGRDGCRVPLPWSAAGLTGPSWLPQPRDWGDYSVGTQSGDPDSFLSLYRTALRLRRSHPALGTGAMRWLDGPADSLIFAREPGFVFAANLGTVPIPLPSHSSVLLSSGPLNANAVPAGMLPPNTAVWLSA
jgi:alpha-glucosidase